MSQLRIFSYLPNPRIWKATVAARLCGITVELRGAAPGELQNWLWDFDARPLSEAERAAASEVTRIGRTGFKGRLFKTPAFVEAHPFGTVPAAFSPDGKTGIFESNSIMRAVARLGADAFPLYGRDAYEAARIDSFLDVSLVFARDSQIYLLALRDSVTPEIQARTRDAFAIYMAGIEQALSPARQFLVGDNITLADICFVAELSLFSNEKPRARALADRGLPPILHDDIAAEYPRAMAHYARLCAHPAFAPDVEPYLAKLVKATAKAA
jgi:glutathione S-transferase